MERDVAKFGLDFPFCGYAGYVNGECEGIVGYVRLKDGLVLVSYNTEEMLRHKVTIWKAALKVMELIKGKVVFSIPDNNYPMADKIAKRLGFHPLNEEEGVWIWGN